MDPWGRFRLRVLLMGVTDADAEAAGIPREQLAAQYAAAIQQAIDRYRVRHSGGARPVSNILAGLVLTYMRAFHVCHRVRIADTTGDVLQRSLLVTRVRTIKNVEVAIPNGAILSSQVLNFSSMARSQTSF